MLINIIKTFFQVYNKAFWSIGNSDLFWACQTQLLSQKWQGMVESQEEQSETIPLTTHVEWELL